jgi:hypothetical protein
MRIGNENCYNENSPASLALFAFWLRLYPWASNVTSELRPTGHSPKNDPKAYAVDRQLHWVVRRGMGESTRRGPLATMPSHAPSRTFRQWVPLEEAGQPFRHSLRVHHL